MARIQTYTLDTTINASDKVIGTDGTEGANNATKNFTVGDLTAYIQNNIEDVEVVGLQGPQGEPGPRGPAGAVGPAGLNWRGSWTSGSDYVEDDAVAYNGASHFCIADVAGGTTNPEDDTTHWALLAAQGANGVDGPRGARGYGITASSGSYYDSLGNTVAVPTDESSYKVRLTFEDATVFTTDNLRGAKGATGDVTTAGTVKSVGVDTSTPLSIAELGPGVPGQNPITDTGTITIAAANGNTDGYLTSEDWNTFNNKIEGTATSGNTAPTEIKVMLTGEYAAADFTPSDNIIYVLI